MTLYHEDTGYSKWNLQAAFYMAIKNNRADIVENLLKNYAVDVDTKFGASEQPAVSLAVECGHADVLKYLLEQGCSVNQADSHGETPLHRSVIDKRLDLTRLLLAERAKSDIKNKATGSTPFHFAVETGRLDILQMMTSSAVDKLNGLERANSSGTTPLLLACSKGLDSLVRHLVLDCGVNLDVRDNLSGDGPLHHALKLKPSTIDILLAQESSCKVQKNFAGLTPLHALAMAKEDRSEVADEIAIKARKLLENGADLESRDNIFRRTPLHLAIIFGNFRLVETLLKFSANVEIKDRQGRSPIYYAAQTNRRQLTELLLMISGSKLISERWINYPTQNDDEIKPEIILFLRNYKKKLPNSLKFLCRSYLRRTFDDEKIKCFPLPTRLVSFVLGDEF